MAVEELSRLSSSGAEDFIGAVLRHEASTPETEVGNPIKRVGESLAYSTTVGIQLPTYPNIVTPISLTVNEFWKRQTPRVQCHEVWVRKETEWHSDESGYLCWDHNHRWEDNCRLTLEILDYDTGINHLAAWFIESVGGLLKCHRIGAERGYTQWPKCWQQFSHFDKGTKEYAEKRQQFCRYWTEELRKKKNQAAIAKID